MQNLSLANASVSFRYIPPGDILLQTLMTYWATLKFSYWNCKIPRVSMYYILPYASPGTDSFIWLEGFITPNLITQQFYMFLILFLMNTNYAIKIMLQSKFIPRYKNFQTKSQFIAACEYQETKIHREKKIHFRWIYNEEAGVFLLQKIRYLLSFYFSQWLT